ncbi:MAG: hypothetical protein GC181_12125 [Bacteroidetes bacterium]|nr:hypothetical protein [Bacteroidota bacterium]
MELILRINKYLINFIGLVWMLTVTYYSYAIIVRFPDCDNVMDLIKNVLKQLLTAYALFLLSAFGINYFIERKLEKRKTSREYTVILFIEFITLILIAFLASNDFYNHCGQSG